MYKLHRPARSWAKAAATCAREGAALATPETAREAGLLAGMMTRPQLRESGVFIGINDLAEEGDWRNYDGTQLRDSGYNSWAPGEPSGGRAENCGALLADGHLADVPCSEPRAFYCRRPEAARAEAAGYAQSEGVEGSWRVQREGRDWVAALQLCARDNATLAVANSSREARALAAVFKDARATFKDVSDADHVHVRRDRLSRRTRTSPVEGGGHEQGHRGREGGDDGRMSGSVCYLAHLHGISLCGGAHKRASAAACGWVGSDRLPGKGACTAQLNAGAPNGESSVRGVGGEVAVGRAGGAN
ncbi:Hemolymph lipopolysaccharide-binding protein [Gryllus bimaculatus]|nr:Hemolymph lipopolysaccharide-binding protein [Gryllus bimaculatus]